MKRWYILTADKEYLCELVMLSATSKTLTMKYDSKQFKIRIHDFKRDYPAAKGGEVVIANRYVCYIRIFQYLFIHLKEKRSYSIKWIKFKSMRRLILKQTI